MLAYGLKRILLAVPVLIGISLLSFILGVLSPGDPAEFALNQNGLEAPTDEQIAAMRAELGLDKPAYIQYIAWISRVLQGDFGASYISGKDIMQELWLRLPVTIELAVLALFFTAVIGITLGIVCAICQGNLLDNTVQFITNIMLAVPGFWLALLLILLFGEILRLLPTSGGDGLENFILPAFAVSFSTMATVCRFMRSSLLKEFSQQ